MYRITYLFLENINGLKYPNTIYTLSLPEANAIIKILKYSEYIFDLKLYHRYGVPEEISHST